MQKFQTNIIKTSESDAAFHQIMKTSCLINELQGKKTDPAPSPPENLQNFNSSNLDFLLNVFTNTNIFPDILKMESANNNFCINPLKMLSYLANNQKEISSTLYNTVMSKKKEENINIGYSVDHNSLVKTQNYLIFHHKNNSKFIIFDIFQNFHVKSQIFNIFS